MTPTSAAFDLNELGQRYLAGDLADKAAMVLDLIAAVEVLQERMAELEGVYAIARKAMISQRECAEAAEARVVEVAGALSELLRWHRNQEPDTDEPPGKFIGSAYTVLAATPAEALERAKAKDEAYEKMVQFLDDWAAQFVCWGMLMNDEANSAVQNFVVRAHDITKTAAAIDFPQQKETIHDK